jgi:DHA1 family multidrug resistance protein-like MFS transporter
MIGRTGQDRKTPSRIQNWPVVLLLAVMLLSGITISPQRAFFPIYVEEQLGYPAVLVSTFVSLGLVLGMLAAIVGGVLSDTVGFKGTLVLGLLGIALANLAYLVRAPWLVLIFWVLGGLGLGLHTLGSMGYLIAAANPQRLGLFSALYHWGYTLGGALSSPVAGFVLDHSGFNAFGLALLALSGATMLGTVLLLPQLQRRTTEKPLSIGETLIGYRTISRRPLMMLLGSMRFLPTCYYGMITVLNPLLINRLAGTKTAVAIYVTLSQVVATLAQIVVGRAADRMGSRRPTLVTFGILVVAIVGQGMFATQLWSYYVFGVLGIAAAWSLATLLPILVSESTAIEERGRVLGALHVLWNLAMIGGSMLGGALLEIAVGLPFAVVALLNIAAVALSVSFFRLIDLQKNRVAPAMASD